MVVVLFASLTLLIGRSHWKKVLSVCPVIIGNACHHYTRKNLLNSFSCVFWFPYSQFATCDKETKVLKAPTDRSWDFVLFTADYELTQLQEKLRETEEAMEKLINRVGPNCDRYASNHSILRNSYFLTRNWIFLHWLCKSSIINSTSKCRNLILSMVLFVLQSFLLKASIYIITNSFQLHIP